MANIKRKKNNFSYLITLLSLLCLLLITNITHASWNHKNVMGASECAECHEDEVDVWKKTAHQKNFKALSKNKDAKKIAKKMGVKKIKKDTAMCSSCHYTVGQKKGKAKIVAGVSCESCHSPAKSWIKIHNNYGGKGVNRKSESASHKKTRYKKLESLNMVRPDNTYGWAKNCLSCHIVANEKLVNTGGHIAGSDFKLSKRTQGKIRHYPKADVATLQYYNLVSYSTELEVSLTALSNASGGKYAQEMQKRANSSLKNLKSANATTPNQYAKKIISLADSANIKAGNRQLSSVAKSISVNIMKMVQKKTGYAYNKSKLKSAPQKIVKKAAPAKIKQKETVSKAAPVKKTTPKIIAPVIKPKPKKQNKKSVKAAVALTPKPIKKTPTVNTGKAIVTDIETEITNIKPTSPNDQLLEEFNMVIPGNFALCQTYTPWILGKQKLNNNTSIPKNGCFGINIKAGRSAQFYLFMASASNDLIRLAPNNCDNLGIKVNALNANQTISIPKPGYSTSAISVNELPDYNKLYVIIADNAYANSEMSRLSANTSSVCNSNKSKTEKNSTTQEIDGMLNAIKKSANGHMDWKLQKFR